MHMKELKADYKAGIIGKEEYVREMHKIHEVLFEYTELIADTDIAKIEITSSGVIMTSGINDIRIACDKDDLRMIPIEIINFDSYEKKEMNMILKMIGKDAVVFDIGANIGWVSMIVARNFPDAKVSSFEPIPKTYRYLAANVRENGIANIDAYNFGFSDEEKDLSFYYYPQGSGNASIRDLSGSAEVEKVTCRVSTLDRFTEKNDIYPDFIKCDVEGAELFVFKGGIDTIKKSTPIVYTEMLRKWAAKFNYHPNEIIDLFESLGYCCYYINGECISKIAKMDENTVDTNFFFLHKDKHNSLLAKHEKIVNSGAC